MSEKITIKALTQKLADSLRKEFPGLEGLMDDGQNHSPAALMKQINGISNKEEKDKAVIGTFYKALFSNDVATLKALAEGDNASGGYLVPAPVRAAIITRVETLSPIRQLATVIPMTKDTLSLPRLDDNATVSWTSENASINTSTVRFGAVTLNASKLAVIIYISSELVEDADVDIVNFISDHLAKRVAREEKLKFLVGNGTGQPEGVTQASGVLAVAADDPVNADDLLSVYYRLPQGYRANAVWFIHSEDILEIRRMKNNDGDYIWKAGLEGNPDLLLGKRVFEDDDLPLGTLVLGDWSQYYIGDRRQMRISISDTAGNAWVNDQVSIKVTERVDGRVAVPYAFVKGTNFSA